MKDSFILATGIRRKDRQTENELTRIRIAASIDAAKALTEFGELSDEHAKAMDEYLKACSVLEEFKKAMERAKK